MSERDRLKIVTLNLWNLNHWSERSGAVLSWLEELDADVVGLQEVARTEATSPAEWLVERTGMQFAFGSFHRPDGTDFGNATLSRFPIADSEQRTLPSGDSGTEKRLCLRVTLTTPRGTMDFYNTHLNYLFHEGYVRESQVVALSEFIEESTLTACPPVVVGDLDAVPGSNEVRYLKGLASLRGRSFHLFDSFEAVNPLEPGFTWHNDNEYASRNRVPDQRIDYVFVGAQTEDGTEQIMSSWVVYNTVREKTWPIDHFGVYAEIRFAVRTDSHETIH